ncbi:MAG: recombinase family protein [Subdoligranulum variabile]|nr:recombinase family protein [Subdoligranulum variabile]
MDGMQRLYFGNLALDPNRQRQIVYYGRVSTEHEAQLEALEKQMQWYEDQTKYHPNWTVVGRYIDEGITGTLAKKRPAFMQMIEDAKRRKFDLIVTREVCRFARNTVDTLVLTRELRNYGVEVYFVSDNIWTMDGDGELRLTIMATLAQEESRKISERVRAGQAISRENGVLYGNGNIIGYDRVGGTYVINPEQAETIRTIFELYAQGLGQKELVNELTRRGCKDGNGNVKWSCVKISRILRNATYMGYVCYNKSKVNNFLEKKRIKNLDEDTFVLKKGDFEPIVSEALWRLCERIRKSRIKKYQMPSGEERRRGSRIPQHLWVKKLRCRCGAGYNRFKWRVLQDGTPIYGYQCNYRTQNPAKSFVEKNHLAGQKSCDAISICEWKLDLMAKQIFDQLWGDQRQAVLKACQMIESCMLASTMQSDVGRAELQRKADKLEQRILNLGQMRADGELTKEQYQKLYAQATKELETLQGKMGGQPNEPENVNGFDLDKIKKGLSQMVDISTPKISEELIEEFVEVVTPVENHHYRWKMSFGETKTAQERSNLLEPENPPVLAFTIDFETARKFRYANGLPRQFRKRDWNDLIVEVYL